MTQRNPPGQRPSPAHRRRLAVIVLVAAPLALMAITLMFRSSPPTATLPGAATAVTMPQQAAVSQPPSGGEIAPPAPALPSAAAPGPQTAEAPASTSAVIPAMPESPPPATSQGSASPAPTPGVRAPAVTHPAQPILTPRAPAELEPVAPGAATMAPNPVPALAEPAQLAVDLAGETWMRHVFDQFLDQVGAPEARLSEPQRDALFAEFMAWRRARDTAQGPPAQPGPGDREKVQEP